MLRLNGMLPRKCDDIRELSRTSIGYKSRVELGATLREMATNNAAHGLNRRQFLAPPNHFFVCGSAAQRNYI